MMPFFLLGFGLLMILIEFYLPGAIMGIIGCLLLLASIILFASQSTSPIAIALFIVGAIASVALMIRFAIWRIVHTKPAKSIYSDDSQVGYQASHYDHTAIGKKGIVLSDLKPGGYILVEGKQHQALSLTGYLPKGTEVMVVSGQEESLIVKKV